MFIVSHPLLNMPLAIYLLNDFDLCNFTVRNNVIVRTMVASLKPIDQIN